MKFDEGFDREKSARTKADPNRGIDFIEARDVWQDRWHIPMAPARSVNGEPRWLTIGQRQGRLWTVCWTMRPEGIRILSVRPSHQDERQEYEAGKI